MDGHVRDAASASGWGLRRRRVAQCDHAMGRRFDDVLMLLLYWIPSLLRRYDVVGDSGGQLVSREADERLGLGKLVRM